VTHVVTGSYGPAVINFNHTTPWGGPRLRGLGGGAPEVLGDGQVAVRNKLKTAESVPCLLLLRLEYRASTKPESRQ